MSNTEPDAGGTQNFFRGLFQRNTTINAMAGSEIKIAGLEEATQQMSALNNELKALVQSLTGLSQQQATLTAGISNTMKSIASNAQQTSSAVEGVTNSVGRFRSGAMSIASIFGSAVNSNFVKDLAMFPLRYITGATEQARNLGMGVSTTLGGQMYATGQSQADLMTIMGQFPGGVRGGVEDIIGLQAMMRQFGAMADYTNRQQANPRTVGFLRGVAELQAMEPGTPVAQLAQTIGSYASNTSAQQQSAYLTGGAFAMIGAGGRQKSVQEWADGILKWLEGQRPGDMRGKGFTYGELLAQQFPGSNIDAWLSAQGVPEGMKEAFWNYALAKSRMTGSTSNNVMPPAQAGLAPRPFTIQPANTGPGQGGNQAWGRLNAATAQARGQFGLGSQLSGMFSNKETANQWFNEIIAQIMSDVIPKQIAGGSLQAMGVMPDPIQELLMTFLERSGTIGAALGGYIGYGIEGLPNLNAGLLQQLFAGGLPSNALGQGQAAGVLGAFGRNPNASGISDLIATGAATLADFFGISDVGDVGGAWTNRGTTSTAGLHPSVRSGVERMMGDNPRIKVTSGLRDTVQQRRLRAAGNTGVSGKPSAHTRGLAADLGPRSEYGWISANASRYGLKSGISHGEPWHVGLPGIGDIGDPPTGPPTIPGVNTSVDAQGNVWQWTGASWSLLVSGTGSTTTPVPPTPPPATTPVTPTTGTTTATDTGGQAGLGRLFDMFKEGFTKQDAIEGIGSLVPTLLNLFLGVFGGTAGGTTSLASIAYDPNLYGALRKAAAGPSGIISIGGAYTNTYDLSAIGGAPPGTTPADTPAGSVPIPTGGGPRSQEAGVAAAVALFNAGFTSRSELEKIVAIAWRESGWDPTAANPNGEDKGLLQINRKAHASRIQSMGYTAADLLDIQKNANVAYSLYKDMGNFMAWNYSEQSMQWGPPPRPGWAPADNPYPSSPFMKTEGSNSPAIVTAAKIPGLGDVDTAAFDTAAYSADATTYAPLATGSSRERVVMFNNTFHINGGGQGGGGIDMRRTVAMMADQLEGEMKKRLARTN